MHGHDGHLIPVIGIIVIQIGDQGYIFEVVGHGSRLIVIDGALGKILDTIEKFFEVFITAAFFGSIAIVQILTNSGSNGNMGSCFKGIQFLYLKRESDDQIIKGMQFGEWCPC